MSLFYQSLLNVQFALTVIGPMSSYTRQSFPLYQVQCRAQIDTLFYNVLCKLFLSACLIVAAFQIRRLEIFWKINFDLTVGIRYSNSDCKSQDWKISFLPLQTVFLCLGRRGYLPGHLCPFVVCNEVV
jgi:hypothetical protein